MISRREALAATAVGGAVEDSDDDHREWRSGEEWISPSAIQTIPPQGAINAGESRGASRFRSANPAIRDQFPSAFSPPATDVGSIPLSWVSFNNAPRRIQNGGWARQVTQNSFCGCRHHLRCQHAADSRRHPGDALAPVCRVGLHDVRHMPDHHSRRIGPALHRGC